MRAGHTAPPDDAPTDGTRLRGRFEIPPDFDPTVDGMLIDLVYEPETDPAEPVAVVRLPAIGLPGHARRLRVPDRTGAVDGITRVRVRRRPLGPLGVTLVRKDGTALTGLRAGALRLVLRSGDVPARARAARTARCAARAWSASAAATRRCAASCPGCEMINSVSGQCMFPYPSPLFEATDPTDADGPARRLPAPRHAAQHAGRRAHGSHRLEHARRLQPRHDDVGELSRRASISPPRACRR